MSNKKEVLNDVLGKKLNIDELSQNLGLEKKTPFNYEGVYVTGDFDAICDCDVGLLNVSISASGCKVKNSEVLYGCKVKNGEVLYTICFTISTVDDGLWVAQCMRGDYSTEEVQVQLSVLSQAFLDFMGDVKVLPTEKELNKFLSVYQMCGKNCSECFKWM